MPKLATKEASSVLNKFERKINRRRAIKAEKRLTSFISNEDMNDIIKIVEPLKKQVYYLMVVVKDGIKSKKVVLNFWYYDGAYGCVVDSTNVFFIDTIL